MKQILIIDDDAHIGNMLEEVLVKEGYKILRAYSGTEALLVLSTAKPDLILLDLMLPRTFWRRSITQNQRNPCYCR